MTLLKIAAGIAGFYLVLVLLIAAVQDRLLFPRWAMRGGTVPLPPAAERLSVDVPGTGPLVGVFLPAEEAVPEDAALLLGFGGNAWDADLLATYLHSVYPDRDIVTFYYRGYGPSAGRPSAAAMREDAERIHDAVAEARRPGRLVAVGLSLGAGPAAHLATVRPVDGLILVTPFDTLEALASEIYPWLPVRLLLRHRMDVAGAIGQSSAQVAIIAAAEDEIVPPRRTEALRGAAGALVLDRVIEGTGHNDIYDSDAFIAAMREALSRIEGRSAR